MTDKKVYQAKILVERTVEVFATNPTHAEEKIKMGMFWDHDGLPKPRFIRVVSMDEGRPEQ